MYYKPAYLAIGGKRFKFDIFIVVLNLNNGNDDISKTFFSK